MCTGGDKTVHFAQEMLFMLRKTLAVMLCIVPPFLCGCQVGKRLPTFSDTAPIHVGSTKLPVIGFVFVPLEYTALQAKMESLLQAPVLFDSDLSADAIAGHLLAGRRKFAVLSAGEYASIKDPTGIEPVAAALSENGTSQHK